MDRLKVHASERTKIPERIHASERTVMPKRSFYSSATHVTAASGVFVDTAASQ